jgi:hypothetical protein
MSLGLELRPREPWPAIMDRYAELDRLLVAALDAIATGDRDRALILAAGVVGKCITLDDRLGLVNLRDDGGRGRPPGVFRDLEPAGSRSRRSR